MNPLGTCQGILLLFNSASNTSYIGSYRYNLGSREEDECESIKADDQKRNVWGFCVMLSDGLGEGTCFSEAEHIATWKS